MNYTATPDSTLANADGTQQIHVNLTDDQGHILFDQWHAQADWDVDAGQTVTASMIAAYQARIAPQAQPVPIASKQVAGMAVQMSDVQASGLIAAATSAPLEAQPDLTAQPMPAQYGGQ